METLQESVVNTIREKCSSDWTLSVFNSHVIVNLPKTAEDQRAAYNTVKKQITACIKEHLPERSTDISIEVRSGSLNCGFKLGATL
ncbi:hypothetical protein DIU31_006000 [Mucilaginibacter rubeus]|uniref:Uncharacterized protein n=1 Tax=Mucilaginibacter rubeus TaxID=2027860 RepID=A0AAE6MH35_9SPHI|nr:MULTISPECIES: hypothetical protein [Mucilaginibacter]QEM03093.1 hypothetical protein DIU31_006000 [Mucilaginibacter rubeus]QEM15712.1 hypothetical protein DIU38_006070 [Mucilaginibacter gossypii]QTE41549.1 hypothetical protein J3L19_21710 [Mucilaginibacter rubeus]QTE48155.1 hypothetical protein J3L21_21710 [Mucilaginibacter rubeus]QTE59546.1 hypothetical protein J3L23_13355 [Mucilaginibacter rubeus]